MNISGHTDPFAVLGHPIGHSLSPVMHNAAMTSMEMDAIYLAFDVHPDRLMEVLPRMADMGFRGVNLTVPLKEVAFNGLDDLDDSARRLGAVNTIEFLDGGLRGHNTDGKGFLLAVDEAFGTGVKGKKVFVLGSGGAGRAVAITCATSGASCVSVTDIDAARSGRVAAEISELSPGCPVKSVNPDPASWPEASLNADIVVQATPVGMRIDDDPVLGPDAFREGQMAIDMIYMYPETAFMKAAAKSGAKSANGLGMLLHQGAHAFTIWTGRTPPVGAMREALEKEVYRSDGANG